MVKIAGKGSEAVRGIGEFQHLWGDKGKARFGVVSGADRMV